MSDNYFKFSAEEASAEFNGNADQNSIYVNVGTSAYGWNVAFDNGINMNLADVREFQLRNGRLPPAAEQLCMAKMPYVLVMLNGLLSAVFLNISIMAFNFLVPAQPARRQP